MTMNPATPRPVSIDRARRAVLVALMLAVILAAIVLAAAVAFDWTMPSAPSFDLTSDPVGNLPF